MEPKAHVVLCPMKTVCGAIEKVQIFPSCRVVCSLTLIFASIFNTEKKITITSMTRFSLILREVFFYIFY